FHGGALLSSPIPVPIPAHEEGQRREVITSLVPYGFELFDSRSGYPAGIRDPLWQQRSFEVLRDGKEHDALVAECVASIARSIRGRGHVAGVPDAAEAARLARDVATLRDLAAPGRRELLEAIESAFGQGERLGRGRVIARALEEVLVGRARGRLAPGTPRSGLAPHVEGKIASLDLPGPPGSPEPKVMDLDPLRSELDRARHVTLHRLSVAGIAYGEQPERANAGELLSARWSLQWSPATEATLEVAGLLGVTLEQATRGALVRREQQARNEDRFGFGERLAIAWAAAECGLHDHLDATLIALSREALPEAGLAESIALFAFLERLTRGHIAGVAEPKLPEEVRLDDVLSAAVRAVEGLSGSTRIEDARALLDVVELVSREGETISGRIGWAIDVLAREGSPLMQGAGGAARVLLGRTDGDTFGNEVGSFVDQGGDALADRLQGALVLALPLFEVHPTFVDRVLDRLEAQNDHDFVQRLPALRRGFAVLPPAARQRMLEAVGARLELEGNLEHELELETTAEEHERFTRADLEGQRAIEALGLSLPEQPLTAVKAPPKRAPSGKGSLALLDRIRLMLGRERERLPQNAMRYAQALDELYGDGRGEGSRKLGGGGGGREAPYPTVREWSDDLEELFGKEVREEVLGHAAASGRAAAALALDPDSVTPSIELLERVLSLKGGLAERDLARMRRLVQRVVDALVEALSQRVRPALAGLVTPRPSRRPNGPLDLRRTVSLNLRTARRNDEGQLALVAERLSFKSRSKRSLDWHLVLVVDVSGSMEASVIYSAMMAAILNALPALTVRFVAFNTQIMDLSERVDDPLGLLLEISVGGGTDIGRGLRYARSLLRVPSRSIVVVVSDFEEGVSVPGLLGETRALVESGAKVLGLAALDDRGAPRYHTSIAGMLAGAGMRVAALTPLELARWVGEQIR
ncbi:MAG: VWA domain-containing protein, partial [Sandaracinaceae bacterium]|nr:VWA domain-containing protein [Sandaracinaceae bacterium]